MGLIWRAAPWLIAIALAAATLLAAGFGFSRDRREMATARQAVARSALSALETSLRENVERTQSVAGLYDASESVSRAEFERFSTPLLQGSGPTAVLWIEHVEDSERRAFERRLSGPITRLGADNRFARQDRRPSYDVLTHVVQLQRTRSTVGLDIGGLPARIGTLRAAQANRAARSTPIVKLAGSSKPGTIVYVPVFDLATGKLRGFSSGAYRVDQLSARIDAAVPAGTGVRLIQGQTTALRSGHLDGAVHQSVIVAGQRWHLAVASARAGGLGYGPALLLIGLPSSALAGLTLLLMARRTRETERLSARRAVERDAAQRGHMASEQRLTTAFEQAPIGMAMLDLDGNFVRVNEALAEITGYPVTQLVGMDFTSLVPADRRAVQRASFTQAAADEFVAFTAERPIIRASGETRWISLHAAMLNGLDGRPELLLHQVIDVTDRRRVRQQLTRSSRHFELSRDLVCTAGLDGYYKELNPAWSDTLGWSDEELRSRPFIEFVHPEDREQTAIESAKLANGEVTVDFVNRYSTKDGGWRWIDWHAAIAPDEDLIYASARDITSRIHAEAALEASERQTRRILETAHDAFISMDAEGRITDWNPQAEAVFGWTRAEALGRSLAETVIPEGLREAHERGLSRFLQTGAGTVTGQLLELSALHRDGHEFPVEFTISPSPGEHGYSFNAFLRDVSERQRTQEALAAAHAQAIESSRLKSEFVANMSHEIRTPLNGVIGMSGLLLETELNREQREYADGVQTSGDALMAVINDVLDFSKIEAGKLDIYHEPFDARHTVETVCSIVAATARAKNVEVMFWIDDTVPRTVSGDVNRIRQVLSNLLTNAVKFTSAGEVVVEVAGVRGTGNEISLRFEVRDTGIGIAPTALEQIFDSFAQADGSTTRRYGGTGLGLTISKQLIGLMDGEIGVSSVPDAGSTFWFSVPLERTSSDEGPPAPSRLLRGARALVIDDNVTSCEMLERHLISQGMACATTTDGQAGLQMLRAAAAAAEPYDLVVLDTDMPGMNAYELAREIRGTPALSSLRLLTLRHPGRDASAGEGIEIDGFVSKPVRRAHLSTEVARVLGPRPSAPGVRETQATVRPPEADHPNGPLVLIAEDNRVNQVVALKLLEKRGFRVDIAGNGREALDMFEHGAYEAIFMDCQMPELNGYGAAAEIRRREGHASHVPIIAMTANTMEGDRERCLAAGMDDYVGKPVRQKDLDEVIARTLGS